MSDMDQTARNESSNSSTGFVINPTQGNVIDQLLNDLAHICPAQFVLLTDVNGQFISARGSLGRLDLIALSSLVASDLAASHEIARLIGQYQKMQLVLREGEKTNSFIVEAGSNLVLFVQVSNKLPLGWARMLILETSRQLAEVVSRQTKATPKIKWDLTTEKLTDALGDAFDSMWTG